MEKQVPPTQQTNTTTTNNKSLLFWRRSPPKVSAGSSASIIAPAVSVGEPTQVTHRVHVSFEPGQGFKGLPMEWNHVIKSQLGDQDIESNCQLIANVIMTNNIIPGICNDIPDESYEQHTATTTALPLASALTLRDMVSHERNPETLYTDWMRIGEGAAGQVYQAKSVTTGEAVALKKTKAVGAEHASAHVGDRNDASHHTP
eukprot:TRINITY_DN6765_c0_g1_i1.p1 TRINITY_DN6765_c0_g1~~TRINITY_DN6765_c0_g1_i1.p1  ORF type:complete len:202 (-),score=38.42 TRINITY_DN6765_c0_g1_i1:299-904(-)